VSGTLLAHLLSVLLLFQIPLRVNRQAARTGPQPNVPRDGHVTAWAKVLPCCPHGLSPGGVVWMSVQVQPYARLIALSNRLNRAIGGDAQLPAAGVSVIVTTDRASAVGAAGAGVGSRSLMLIPASSVHMRWPIATPGLAICEQASHAGPSTAGVSSSRAISRQTHPHHEKGRP
jgi:hypothetical protein